MINHNKEVVFGKKISTKNLNKFKERTAYRNNIINEQDSILRAWDEALNSQHRYLHIAHSVSPFGSVSVLGTNCESPFLARPAEAVFSSWDIISTSCMGKRLFSGKSKLGGAPLDIHIDLKVPVQNIIGTHLNDVYFNNFAGLEGNRPGGKVIDKGALARSIFEGIARENSAGFFMEEPYNTLRHPSFFQQKIESASGEYNEILLVGRPGVKTYMNFPCTENIKVRNINYWPNYLYQIMLGKDFNENHLDRLRKDLLFIKRILRINSINKFLFSMENNEIIKQMNISQHIVAEGFVKQRDGVYVLV